MRANPVWCVVGVLAATVAAAAHVVAWWVRYDPGRFGAEISAPDLSAAWNAFGNLSLVLAVGVVALGLYTAEPVRRYGLDRRHPNPFE